MFFADVRNWLFPVVSGTRQIRPLLPRHRTRENPGLKLLNSRVGRLSKTVVIDMCRNAGGFSTLRSRFVAQALAVLISAIKYDRYLAQADHLGGRGADDEAADSRVAIGPHDEEVDPFRIDDI
jgi:hypothetical protein